MIKKLLLSLSFCTVIIILQFDQSAVSWSGSPPLNRTNAPFTGIGVCTDCHSGVLNSGGGGVSISSSASSGYDLSTTYDVTVTVTHAGALKYGFEMTAHDAAGVSQGSFVVTDATNTSSGTQAGYGNIFHNNADLDNVFNFQWTSPASDVGTITLYAVGNGANGLGTNAGDFIYSTTLSLSPDITFDCPGLSANIGEDCDDGDDCTTGETVQGDCTCSGGALVDVDLDGVCDTDVADNCIGPNIGEACDDNDECTENDLVLGDCTCIGTIIDTDNDGLCDTDPLDDCIGDNSGADCDDGDELTVNDVIQADCSCTGIPNPNYCFDWNGYIGDGCDDSNIGTLDDLITADCECIGTPDENYCLDLDLFIGDICDDLDESTTEDMVSEDCVCAGSMEAPGFVQIQIALEGFLGDDGMMSTAYADNGLLPLGQSFDEQFGYMGTESVITFPKSTTDWIYLELRDAVDISVVVHQEALLVRNDGFVMDLMGNIDLTFGDVTGMYYIIVNHASHLGVITANTYDISNNETISLSGDASLAMGVEQLIDVNGLAALYAGDFDGTGVINVVDFNLWRSDNAAVNAYVSYDADGNGVVNVSDYNLWFKNRSKVGNVNIQ